MALTCRVQYLNDCDPFEYLTHYPEPPRPPVHTFSCTLPLVNQIAAVHRLLKAPHRVSHSPFLDLTVMKGLKFKWSLRFWTKLYKFGSGSDFVPLCGLSYFQMMDSVHVWHQWNSSN